MYRLGERCWEFGSCQNLGGYFSFVFWEVQLLRVWWDSSHFHPYSHSLGYFRASEVFSYSKGIVSGVAGLGVFPIVWRESGSPVDYRRNCVWFAWVAWLVLGSGGALFFLFLIL